MQAGCCGSTASCGGEAQQMWSDGKGGASPTDGVEEHGRRGAGAQLDAGPRQHHPQHPPPPPRRCCRCAPPRLVSARRCHTTQPVHCSRHADPSGAHSIAGTAGRLLPRDGGGVFCNTSRPVAMRAGDHWGGGNPGGGRGGGTPRNRPGRCRSQSPGRSRRRWTGPRHPRRSRTCPGPRTRTRDSNPESRTPAPPPPCTARHARLPSAVSRYWNPDRGTLQ